MISGGSSLFLVLVSMIPAAATYNRILPNLINLITIKKHSHLNYTLIINFILA